MTGRQLGGPEPEMLRTDEVARMFGVDPKTVTRWAKAKKIQSVRTPAGHRRYPAAPLRAYIARQLEQSRNPESGVSHDR